MSNHLELFQPICEVGDYLWHPEHRSFMKTSYVSSCPDQDGDTFVEGDVLQYGNLVHHELHVRRWGWLVPTQAQLEAGRWKLRALELALLQKKMAGLQRVMDDARQRLEKNEIEYQALDAKYRELERWQ